MKKQPMKKIATKAIKSIPVKSNTVNLKSVAAPKGKAPVKIKQTVGDRYKNADMPSGRAIGTMGALAVTGRAAMNLLSKKLSEK